MIFGYSAKGGSLGKKGLLVALGIVAIPFSLQMHSGSEAAATKVRAPSVQGDPRVVRLHRFLTKLDCPVANMSEEFVRVADENHLDWRLLPSIAVIESGGGKAYKNNNIFGWNRGDQAFATIGSGLELVGYQLGRGSLYRRHDVLGKLRIYNEHEDYSDAVMSVMNRISPRVHFRMAKDQFEADAMVVRN